MILCNDCQTPLEIPDAGKVECTLCGKLWELNDERTAIKSVTIVVSDISQKVAGKSQKGVATKE